MHAACTRILAAALLCGASGTATASASAPASDVTVRYDLREDGVAVVLRPLRKIELGQCTCVDRVLTAC